jgi:hypothetical protein
VSDLEASTTEDGSMFETLADFFSVVALAAIVSVMMYGASLGGSAPATDVVATSDAGPAELSARRRIAILLTERGNRPRAEVRDTAALLAAVDLVLAPGEARSVTITMVPNLISQLSGGAPVAVECVLDSARSDALAAVFADLVRALQQSGRPCAALGVF